VTTFFASAWGDKVYLSHDGSAWTVAGTGFPAGATRIGLAVQRANPNVVYAMVANASFALLGVYRLDNATGAWRQVSGAPASVLGQQGDYDLTIAIDPNDTNMIFMGGQAVGNDGAVYRAVVTSSMAGGSLTYSMVPTFVGADVHADVHAILYSPGNSSNVWALCDGGVFKTDTATGASSFQSRNVGLATLMSDYLSQHPTQPAVIFCGLQDNGTVRYTGEECWTHVFGGDGGYCVVNWNDPFKVLVYADGSVLRATDGGVDYPSWTNVTPAGAGWVIMAQPIVSAPYNPANPADADVVAYGAGNSLFISTDFGSSWSAPLTVSGGGIFSMVFASASRLYIGMTGGRVYRYDFAGGAWNQTRIDNAAAGPLPLTGIVSDIEVDPADASGQSIFITFGGTGDYRHVWRFNGTSWQARSGPTSGAITSLLDVEHNAVIADPVSNTLYVGADIGVWKSTDGGMNWSIIENGLPDAAVLDLQLHAPTRLLRAALHGRGVYELKLDPPTPPDVELYVRDTTLDVGRMATVDGLNDPSQWPIVPVHHWESVNIRVDVPTPAGYQTPTPQIDFYQFNDKIVDGSSGVATIDPSTGTVFNRVYVEVHNRGIKVATSVQVMLLLTDASTNLNPLPAGYTTNVQNGMPISTPQWQTVGIKTITNLKVGFPQIVEFNLPSTMLPPPASLPGDAHFCTVALLHSSDDPYTNTITDVDALTVAEHKVCQKNLNIVQFVGTPPPPGIGPGRWGRIVINAERKVKAGLYDLVLDLNRFTGKVGVLLPKSLMSDRSDEADELRKGHHIAPAEMARDWAKAQQQHLERFMKEGRFSYEGCKRMLADIAAVEAQPLIIFDADDRDTVIHHLSIRPGHSHSAFLWIEPSPKMEIGSRQSFTVILRDARTQHTLGGSTYQVQRVSLQPSQAS
jgi:hypothetical protein